MSGDFGFVYARHFTDNRASFSAGDDVIGYELDEPLPAPTGQPHGGCDLELLAYQAVVDWEIKTKPAESIWREDEPVYCDCRAQRQIASVLIHRSTGRRWVSPRGERTPSGFRGSVPPAGAWPMHGNPGEYPHTGSVCTCNGCKKAWLLMSTHDEVIKVRIRRAVYGVEVKP